jgi:hypothetical protein
MYAYIYREIDIFISIYIYSYMYICCHFKWKTGDQAIFLNRCLSFVPFVYKETNGSYQFAKELNGLNGLAHLWLFV